MTEITWIRIIRPLNLAIVLFTQILATFYLLDVSFSISSIPNSIILIYASTILITAGGYLINDYYDIKIDYINKPDEVIAGRYIKRRWVLLFSIVAYAIAILFGALISWRIFFLNTLSAFLLWFYSNHLKRQPFVGNFSVALLTSLSLLILGIHLSQLSDLLIIYSVFAFFITLIREIIKDIEDYEGDKSFGCKTLPIILGTRKTKQIIYVLITIFFSLLSILSYQSNNFIIMILFTVMSFLLVHFTYKVYRADTKQMFSNLSSYSKRLMVFGVLSMIFL
ncbi:MAG: geranylgeranylglycerol-phosphate geranylgeranyltransferase [Bacteroidota bacterium]